MSAPKRIRAWYLAERMQRSGKYGSAILCDGTWWAFTGTEWVVRKGPPA